MISSARFGEPGIPSATVANPVHEGCTYDIERGLAVMGSVLAGHDVLADVNVAGRTDRHD